MSANSHNRPSICTASGIEFFPLDPRPEDVRLTDIAHALAQLPRYTGHAREPYSVAQHSVFVADMIWEADLPAEAIAAALLDDSAEAYLNDIAGPLKCTAYYKEYRRLESLNKRAILDAFDLRWPSPAAEYAANAVIKDADILAKEAERRDLMPRCDWWPVAAGIGWIPEIVPLPWREARDQFLDRARSLGLSDMSSRDSVQAFG